MIKMIFFFLLFFVSFFFGIKAFHDLRGVVKWKLTKYVMYSIFCSLLTILVLFSIVLLF
jgi:hypothetical protein